MRVRNLIEILQKCNPDGIVIYDAGNAYKNYDLQVLCFAPEEHDENEMQEFGVDDVLIGSGTLRGFVFLTEDKLEENEEEDDGK